jgi:hypothetical protein
MKTEFTCSSSAKTFSLPPDERHHMTVAEEHAEFPIGNAEPAAPRLRESER